MSAYPLILEGTAISALVVGGGAVAARKVASLLDAGARVHVVAPEVSPEISEVALTQSRLTVTREPYASYHLGTATLIVAATNDPTLNAAIAREARDLDRLVNVVDAPEAGNFVTPAVHRAGDIVIAVSAGGVPAAAARIRDAVAQTVDARYGEVIEALASLRRAMLDRGQREQWSEASRELIADDFCAQVESGRLASRVRAWR